MTGIWRFIAAPCAAAAAAAAAVADKYPASLHSSSDGADIGSVCAIDLNAKAAPMPSSSALTHPAGVRARTHLPKYTPFTSQPENPWGS
jgi:hypothetical protein